MKVNFGCGNNRLEGWENFNEEVNITLKLPFEDNSVNFVLAEHCVEHITHRDAYFFFVELHRVLKPGGVARIIVPGIDRLFQYANEHYFDFLRFYKLGSHDLRGAFHNIICNHGHQSTWTQELLTLMLTVHGFTIFSGLKPYESNYPELQKIDGHGIAIGEEFNEIESVIVEAVKGGD